MADLAVTLLAIFFGFIPAYFVEGLLVSMVGNGRVRTLFSHGIVKKHWGVLAILVEIAVVAVVAMLSDGFFQTVYENNASRLYFVAAGVAMWLVIVARMRVGGNYGKKETASLVSLGAIGVLSFLYGAGVAIAVKT